MNKNIRESRKGKGLTQKQFARLVGCSQSMVVHVETGARQVSYEKARVWSEVLGIDPRLIRPDPYSDNNAAEEN